MRTRSRFPGRQWWPTTILRVFVLLTAALQGVVVGGFALTALAGDDWGIARAVALLLTVPLVVLTGGALILTARGHLRWASAIALLSILLMWLAWWQA